MYPVSSAFLNVVKVNTRKYYWTGRITTTAGNAYDFMVLCSAACNVALAQDRETIETMPNGNVNLSIYTDNDIETYRDVLFYVGQVLGGFFVINRAGELELRKYGNTPVLTVERKHRFTSSFSDFITRYTAVSSTNLPYCGVLLR